MMTEINDDVEDLYGTPYSLDNNLTILWNAGFLLSDIECTDCKLKCKIYIDNERTEKVFLCLNCGKKYSVKTSFLCAKFRMSINVLWSCSSCLL